MADTLAKSSLVIEITGNSKNAEDALKRTESAIKQVSASTDSSVNKFKEFGEKIDGAGRQSMIALRSIGEVAAMGGLDKSLVQSTMNAAQMTDAIGDLSGAFAAMSPWIIAATAAGAGLALILTKLTAQSEKVKDLNAKLADLGKIDSAVAGLMELTGATEEQAKTALEAAQNDVEYARQLRDLANAAQEQSPIVVMLKDAWQELQNKLGEVGQTAQQLLSILIGTGAGVGQFIATLKDTGDIQKAQEAATKAQSAATLKMGEILGIVKVKTADQTDAQKKLNALVAEAPKHTKEYAASMREQADAMQKIKEAQDSILRGMVEKALTPTTVTAGDMEASKKGTYSNKWDEFRRRLEAVAGGDNASKFGAGFEAAFQKLGMSAEQAAAKFKDFSLFADPKNLKLVDWEAMTQDIGNQLLGLVGKANLMKEGFAKAWASLSKDQKASLRELGIESAGDAKKVLAGTAQNLVDPFTEKENVAKFQQAGAGVVNTIKAGILDKETQKSWAQVPEMLVKSINDYFAMPDTVKALMAGGAGIVNQIAQGIRDNSTILSDVLVIAVMKALQDAQSAASGNAPSIPASANVAPTYSGSGTVNPKSGGVNFVYSPTVSLATQAEAVNTIAPIVRQALTAARQ